MTINTDKEKIKKLLTRGVEQIYPRAEFLQELLQNGRRLRLYHGLDPTAPFLHIGHALQLRKLREFQELGHEVILLIGSFTGMIGDPTDKGSARAQLTRKQVLENAATYKKQASKFLSFSGKNAARIMFNHKWLAKLTLEDVVDLASHFTVQQMLERDMFDRRLQEGKPIYLHEFLYPLMQGYDSVAMNVDLEIGGSDQTFNMLAGRTLMKAVKGKEKAVLTLKLITNDEGKKMSKSEGGFIALSDSAEDIYGKIMAMADSMILPYFELATDVTLEEIEGMKIQLENGVNPRDLKTRLAATVVAMCHSEEKAQKAAEHFELVFRQHAVPTDVLVHSISGSLNIIDLLLETDLVSSKNEARRLIEQGAIKFGGEVVGSATMNVKGTKDGVILQRGKRQFVRIIS